jgi:hypothetical protein
MSHIVLTPEQADVVRQTLDPIEARDEQGRTLGHLTPLSPEELKALSGLT